MFEIAKIADLIATPSNLIFILVIFGTGLLFTRWSRGGRRILAVASVLFVIAGVTPLPEIGVRWLEDRVPVPTPLPPRVDGIVVLGGGGDAELLQSRPEHLLGDGNSRSTAFFTLANLYPEARLVFSGGTGSLTSDTREADMARQIFQRMGLVDDRIIYERNSRNTRENAVFSYNLAKPKADETWLLVTSANHLPRAIGAFRKAGWSVIGVPAGFQARATGAGSYRFDVRRGLRLADLFVHEMLGLAYYRWAEYSDALVPGP
ncbi:MAG: YdcF family protein [Alphaproteobacteria bacterium]|nr:YdcF family protein [Alphaproteobacteria bacterium]